MNNVVIVAPHPDDETLGCGGAIFKHRSNGDKVYWIIVTGITEKYGFSCDKVNARSQEIETIAAMYQFTKVFRFDIPTTQLDCIPLGELVNKFSEVFNEISPHTIYLPFRGDVHSDHKIVFDAALSSTKWFRYPSIKRILCYETVSETEFGLDPSVHKFTPNVFVDITASFCEKIEAMKIYKSELGKHPFPRNEKVIEALAMLRGATSGCEFAEGFILLKEILK